jgi:glycosyltransferase involved in cell wall biosynthesis
MRRQRICITTLEYPPDVGGVGESVYRIARMLTAAGYDIHVAVFHSKQRKTEGHQRSRRVSTLEDGVWVHRLESARRSDEPILQDYLSEIYVLLKALHHDLCFDAFHAFFINETGFLTTLLAKEYGIPVINSVRGSDLHKHVFNPKHHGQISWILDQSDWVTFVSRDLQRRGCVLVPSLAQKSSAFWNSIQPIEFDQLPSPDGVLFDTATVIDTNQEYVSQRTQRIVIGSVGRFRDKKGLEFLLDACVELSSELDLTVLLVGDVAERERAYWETEFQRSELGDRLILTGMVERTQALAYLPHIDIFAVPSLHDGCPNAMLEAMLAGCAVVGSNVDAIGEILDHGHNGWIVRPGSTTELVDAIRTLARSPQLRQQLGNSARNTVLKALAPAVEQANWCTVYHRIFSSQLMPDMAIA